MSIIPWLECTKPDDEQRTYCLAGLKAWAPHADTAIVTTWPKYVDDTPHTMGLYRWLVTEWPGHNIDIIGGFKTSRILGTSPVNPSDWSEIRAVAEKVADHTGSSTVVLDSELTFLPWTRGKQPIDPWEFRQAIMVLADSPVTYYWYQPSILDADPRFPMRRYRSRQLVDIIQDAVPNSLFDDTSMAWPDWTDNRRQEADRGWELGQIVGVNRIRERLMVTPDGMFTLSGGSRKPCHTPREAKALMDYMSGGEFTYIIYPGYDNWLRTAKAWGSNKGESRC